MKLQEFGGLSEEQLSALKNLRKLNLDSIEGFNAAAEITNDRSLRNTFTEIASQRSKFANEIEGILRRSGSITDEEGTSMGTVRRWWMQLKNSVSKLDNYAILAEVERSEDAIKEAYEESVNDFQYTDVANTVQRQCSAVVTTHNQVRDMRDRAK